MFDLFGRSAVRHPAAPDRLSGAGGDLARVELLRLAVQRIAEQRPQRADRLPGALNELYPIPSRVPDDLAALIDAVVNASRPSSSR